jgi:hypothetical protein
MPGKHCQGVEVLQQANAQFHPPVYSGPLPRRLAAHTASATEASTSKPPMAVFSAGVVLLNSLLKPTDR